MSSVKISVKPNGPLRVEAPEGGIELVDSLGAPYNIAGKPAFSLCRCGLSANKPFCDGSHKDKFLDPAIVPPPVVPPTQP